MTLVRTFITQKALLLTSLHTQSKRQTKQQKALFYFAVQLQTFDQCSSNSEFAFKILNCAYSYLTLFELLIFCWMLEFVLNCKDVDNWCLHSKKSIHKAPFLKRSNLHKINFFQINSYILSGNIKNCYSLHRLHKAPDKWLSC